MLALYESLSEKDRRRYAAEKLGHGGIEYVSKLFGCDADTVRRGSLDVDKLPADEAAGRIRRSPNTGLYAAYSVYRPVISS